jgi:predicted dehydrogenase
MVRVGIIGTGWGVNIQLPIFKSQGMEVTAIYSRSLEKAQGIAEKHEIKHAFDTIEDIVNCSDVDVISVVSPTHLHQEHALAALAAGKHVLCDKPTALSAEGAGMMVAAAKERPNQLALIDHELRFLPFFQEAKDAVASGLIGDIWHCDVVTSLNFGHFGRTFQWWNEREKGGGVLGAVGVHMIDLLAFISGIKIVQISAKCSVGLKEKPERKTKEMKQCSAAEHVSAHFQLEGGAAGSIVLSSISTATPRQSITIVGSGGTLEIDILACTARVTDRKGLEVKATTADFSSFPPAMQSAFPAGTVLLAAAMKKAIETNDFSHTSSACDFEGGCYVQSVVDAIWHSSDTSSPVSLAGARASRL